MELKTCTDKLSAAATVHFLRKSDLYTLNGLSDEGTCFPTADMTPYMHLFRIILTKAPPMIAEVMTVKKVHVVRIYQQISI